MPWVRTAAWWPEALNAVTCAAVFTRWWFLRVELGVCSWYSTQDFQLNTVKTHAAVCFQICPSKGLSGSCTTLFMPDSCARRVDIEEVSEERVQPWNI
jgi:hypothetical protein